MRGVTIGLIGLVAAALAVPAAAQPRPHRHLGHASRTHHASYARDARGAVPYPRPWGTAVYGSSLPFVQGTCIDPFDPDPIGGPDRVGEGGPGGYGPQCRAQAGVIPGTTLR